MRQSGLDVVGRVPWGSHFCQFYQTKQDLLDVLVPYFRQGLASNEYCMWVTSEPLGVDEAWQALRAREPGLERAAQMGQIEILDYHDWYLRGGTFQAHEVLAGWIERLQAARDRGFDGLRLTGNTFWLEKKDWKDFVEYEESINKVIGRYPIIALCTYCLDRCGIDEVMDVLVHHQFALIKRQGRWQLIRSAEHEHLTRKLLENEERFRLAVKATRDAIWDLDLSTGTVQWNDTYAELFGRPPESGGSWQWWIDHIHPEDRERTVSGIREAITGRASTWVGEYRFQRPDGSWADVHDRAYIARDEAGKAWRVVGAMLDDTHRKAAERQLSESERHHRLLFETMLQGVVYQDAAGRIISMNPAAERILGKSPEDFLGRTSEDEEHHTLREDGTPFPGLEHPAMVALRTGRELRDVVMGVFNPRDPGYRWISISAVPLFREGEDTPYQVYTLFNDITAHRQAEQALQLSEARYRTLFDGMTEGYALHEIVLDEHGQPADSRFLEINPAFERLTGLKRKDVVGRLRSEVLPGEDPEWVAIYADVALTGRPAHFENYSIVIGKYYEVLASRPAPGQIAVLFVDVTDRRQAEQELARLNQELQRRIVELETILDTVPIGIGIAEDPECRKIRGNAALAEMLGQPPGANLSKSAPGGDAPANFRTMKDGRELPADQLPMQVAAAKGIPVFNADFDLVHDNGRLLRFFGNATPLFDEEGRTRGSIGAFWDISPLKAAQEVLEKSHDELERKVQQRTEQLRRTIQVLRMVSGCNHALVHAGDEQQLIEEICRVIHDVGGYHMVWVGYAENDPDRTIRPVASIGPEDSYLQRVRITWGDDELGRGPTGTAVRTGTVCINQDFETDPKLAPWREEALRHGFRSSIALPLIAKGRTFGALTIYADQPHAFEEEQVTLLEELADDLAFGIMALRGEEDRVRAERTLEQRASQLQALASQLTLAEQHERKRISRLLHDDLQQLLVGAKFVLGALSDQDDRQSLEHKISQLSSLLDEAIRASRTLTAELSPPVLHEQGLVPGLKWLVRHKLEKYGLQVKLTADEDIEGLDEHACIFIYESVRELLFNVVKHAGVKQASLSVDRVGNGLLVTVADEGAGFDPSLLDAATGTGGGFGLFSIRERLRSLGGSLEIASAPGRGSRFTLQVPGPHQGFGPGDDEAAGAVATAPARSAVRAVSGKIRVLLADDHPVTREGLARLIDGERDLEVVGEAANGRAAVDIARRLHPDVIVMDVSMPDLNGIEATRAIVAEQPGIRVVGLSMHERADMAAAMCEAGASVYLTKDGPIQDLLAAIRAGRETAPDEES